MTDARRSPADLALSAVVAILLVLFIAYPIGAILYESVVISGPMSKQRLKEITREALAVVPDDERQGLLDRWVKSATPPERIAAMTAALDLAGERIDWDRGAAFDRQAEAQAAALAALSSERRRVVESEYPTALVMLHKRVALAFKVRSVIGDQAFDRLRNGAEHRYGWDHYRQLFDDPYLLRAAINSLTLASLSVVMTVTVAFALVYGFHAGAIPRPGFFRSVVLLPLVAPPVLVAAATVMLFGRRGLVTHTLLDNTLGLIDADETNLYGFLGVVVAQTLSFVPAATIVLDSVLRRHNGRLDEAAAGLGAGPVRVFRTVTLPMAWPGLQRAIVLVFIMSLTDFGNPLILGRDSPVIAGVIYDEITAFQNTSLAAALCVWLMVPAFLLHVGLGLVGGRRRFTTTDAASAAEGHVPAGWRVALTSVAVLVTALIVAIYGTMALGAFVKVWGTDWTLTLGYFLNTGVDVGLAGTGYGSSDRGLGTVWTSLWIAAAAAPLGGLLSILVAYVVERIRPPGAEALAFLALVPAVLPGIIFGIGYVVAFSLPFGIKALSLTGTSAILVINILFSNMFVGVLSARAALQRSDRGIDEAAEGLGAGLFDRLRLVTLPLLGPSALLGALYVFVDGLTTLSSVIFLVSGDHKLASVAIFNHASSSDFGYAAAKSLAILALALSAMGLIALVERRHSIGRGRRTIGEAGVALAGLTTERRGA